MWPALVPNRQTLLPSMLTQAPSDLLHSSSFRQLALRLAAGFDGFDFLAPFADLSAGVR